MANVPTRLDTSHREDKLGTSVQVTQLTDKNGVSVGVEQLTPFNGGAQLQFNALLEAAGTIAAAGTNQGNATAVAHNVEWVTGADGTKGVILPASAAGMSIFLKNDDAANAILKVYPATGEVINALAANAAISMALKTSATFICAVAGTWHTIPLVPS